MVKRKAHVWYALLILVEIAALIYLISGYTKEKTVIDIPHTDFIGTTIPGRLVCGCFFSAGTVGYI